MKAYKRRPAGQKAEKEKKPGRREECAGIMKTALLTQALAGAAGVCLALFFPRLRFFLLAAAAVLFPAVTAVSFYFVEKRVNDTMRRVDDTILGLLHDRETSHFSQNEDSLLGKFQVQILKMHDILRSQEAREKELRENISSSLGDLVHQINTPITNLVMYSDFLQQKDLSDEERLLFAGRIKKQAEKLSWLGEGFSRISRLETGVISLSPSPQNILPVLLRAAQQAEPKALKRGNEILFDCDQDLTAIFDAKWTEEVFYNLLDNAVKYGEPGGPVAIRAQAFELYLRVDICNRGQAIPPEEYPKIFHRFRRGGTSLETEGVGLGLYLAREITKRQGGYIRAGRADRFSDPAAAETVFSVFLPRERPVCQRLTCEEPKA